MTSGRDGLLLASAPNIILFSPAAASWTALDLVAETPEQGQKLQHCEGHCRNDEDCEIGLKCVVRSNGDFVEVLEDFQCTGTLEYGVNYCVNTSWRNQQAEDKTPSVERSPPGDNEPNQKENARVDTTSKEEDGADNIVIETPPFVLGIKFNTPSRRQLGDLADNIGSLESIVAYLIGTEMITIYPDAFQDIDIVAEHKGD